MSKGGAFLKGLIAQAGPLLLGCKPGCKCPKHGALDTFTDMTIGALEEGARRKRARASKPKGAPAPLPTGRELVRAAVIVQPQPPSMPTRPDVIDVEYEEVAPAEAPPARHALAIRPRRAPPKRP